MTTTGSRGRDLVLPEPFYELDCVRAAAVAVGPRATVEITEAPGGVRVSIELAADAPPETIDTLLNDALARTATRHVGGGT